MCKKKLLCFWTFEEISQIIAFFCTNFRVSLVNCQCMPSCAFLMDRHTTTREVDGSSKNAFRTSSTTTQNSLISSRRDKDLRVSGG